MSGWFAVQRDFFDHKLFKKEPFTEREAWLWIIANAAWEQTTHRVEGQVVTVERGSFFCTQRELAHRFQWGTTKTRNFLKLTQEQNMLELNNETKKTLVSVCNYEQYQSKQNNDKTTTKQPRTENETTTKQRQNTKEETKQINNITTNNIDTPLPPPEPMAKQANPSSRGTRLSNEWVLSDDDFQFGIDLGFEPNKVRFIADEFKDYWIGVSGAKATKKDWPATWRNWIRRKTQDQQPINKGNVRSFQQKPKVGIVDVMADIAAEYRSRGQ